MEICTCPKCKEFQFTDQDGQQHQGVLLSQSACNRHWVDTEKIGPILSDIVSKNSIEEHSNKTSQLSSSESETSSSFSAQEKQTSQLIWKESQKFPRAHKPQNHHHPHSRYATQRFSDWLTWFIPEFEDLIDEWKKQVQNKNDSVSDYQQSLAWKNLYPASQQLNSSSIHLSFSLFVNWFNPLTNKLAGKQVSLGILALNCLNLPPTA
ncbi:hypothetical protein O181_063087 [Austropuccinia psidii MF-1]|uniref:Uncharacterized protein n=1 Tax=Austropuccinia psidii MF-1 TaxID=1389203 RepID=A0A9Q3ENW2_9BASI|nr:hypothetical protein [Austropuccinia psidii MF-1]